MNEPVISAEGPDLILHTGDGPVTRIGRPEAGSHPHPVNFAEVQVEPKPSGDTAAISAEIRARLAGYPGIQINIGQPIQHQFDELLSGVRAQLATETYGDGFETGDTSEWSSGRRDAESP